MLTYFQEIVEASVLQMTQAGSHLNNDVVSTASRQNPELYNQSG